MAKVIDRILLLIYAIAIAFISSVIAIGIFGGIDYADARNFVADAYDNGQVKAVIITISVILVLFSLRFVYVALRVTEGGNATSIDQRTDFGDVRISLETVENLSLKAAGRVKGMEDLKARVKVTEAGLELIIRAVVDGETAIPLLSEETQRTVKQHVEEITGIPVSYVTVYVANVIQSAAFRGRVE